MDHEIINRLEAIDEAIINSIKADGMCEFEKNLNDFENAQVFVGCTGCGGTQMCNGAGSPQLLYFN